MEEIVSFSCGFALAYLTVRAIRSFGSTVGLVFLIFLGSTSYASPLIKLENNGGTTIAAGAVTLVRQTDSAVTVLNSGVAIAPGGTRTYDFSTSISPTGNYLYDIKVSGVTIHASVGGTSGTATGSSPNRIWSGAWYEGPASVWTLGGVDYYYPLAAAASYTNYVVAPACVTNNFAVPASFWLEITEGGNTEIAGPHYLQPGEIFCTPAFTNHQGITLQWVAYQSNDGFSAPTPVGDPTEGTPQVDSSETPDPSIPPAVAEGSVDPFGDIPVREGITTNETQAARQNSEGIVRAIGESSDRQSATLSNLFTGFGFQNLASLTNLSSSPTNDYGALLEEITNNTHQANLLSSNDYKLKTNVAGVGTAFDSIKDAFEASLSNAIVAGSNSAAVIWNESQLAGVYSDLTNGMSDTWIYEETAPPASTFGVDLGRGFSWDLNPFASQTTVTSFDGLRSRLGYVCTYIRSWMSWAIGFALFWMCWKKSYYLTLRLHSVEAHINGPSVSWDEIAAIGASLFTGGTAAAIWIGIKKFALVMFITFLTVVIGTLPSLLLVFLSDLGYVPLSGDGFFEQLKTDGLGETLLSTAALWFFWILGHAIPWVVLSTAFVNYMLYDFYSIVLFNLVCTVLRATRILANRPR